MARQGLRIRLRRLGCSAPAETESAHVRSIGNFKISMCPSFNNCWGVTAVSRTTKRRLRQESIYHIIDALVAFILRHAFKPQCLESGFNFQKARVGVNHQNQLRRVVCGQLPLFMSDSMSCFVISEPLMAFVRPSVGAIGAARRT